MGRRFTNVVFVPNTSTEWLTGARGAVVSWESLFYAGGVKFTHLGCLYALVLLGCKKAEQEQTCERLYKSAQAVVMASRSGTETAVEQAREAVLGARTACRAAEKYDAVDQMTPAVAQLDAQLAYLRKKPSVVPQKVLSKEEHALILRDGDPRCPKGQGYKDKQSGTEVRCRGPQLVHLGWAQAKDYFELRGYKVDAKNSRQIKAEFGAELFVFDYSIARDPSPPTCLTLYPVPGVPMLEAVARATGVRPDRIKPPAPLRTEQGALPIAVEEGDTKLTIRLGNCR